MKKNITTVILALVFGSSVLLADEANEKTFTGKVACAKCTVSKSKKCGAAFVLTNKKGEEKVYLIRGKGGKFGGPDSVSHGLFCKRGTYLDVTLTGHFSTSLSDVIMATKVELLKKKEKEKEKEKE